MKNLYASLSSNNIMNDNKNIFYNIFANEINIRNENKELCGDGIYLFQDIKIA